MSQLLVTTSWDDGHPSDLRLVDLLERHALPGTFYIPRQWSLPTLDPASIAARGPAFEVGGHTINHVVLTQTPDDTAATEITDARRWIEDRTGRACTMFCPPRGRFSRRHLGMMKAAGYTGFRTVEGWSTLPPEPHDGLLELRTTVQAYPIHRLGHLRNAVKRRSAHNAVTFVRFGWQGDWALAALTMFKRMLSTGGVFHLWGHSWELDQANQWDILERVLQSISQHADRYEALTNGQLAQRFAMNSAS